MKTILVTAPLTIPIGIEPNALREGFTIEYRATLEIKESTTLEERPYSCLKDIKTYFKNSETGAVFPTTNCLPKGLQIKLIDDIIDDLIRSRIIKASKEATSRGRKRKA